MTVQSKKRLTVKALIEALKKENPDTEIIIIGDAGEAVSLTADSLRPMDVFLDEGGDDGFEEHLTLDVFEDEAGLAHAIAEFGPPTRVLAIDSMTREPGDVDTLDDIAAGTFALQDEDFIVPVGSAIH